MPPSSKLRGFAAVIPLGAEDSLLTLIPTEFWFVGSGLTCSVSELIEFLLPCIPSFFGTIAAVALVGAVCSSTGRSILIKILYT